MQNYNLNLNRGALLAWRSLDPKVPVNNNYFLNQAINTVNENTANKETLTKKLLAELICLKRQGKVSSEKKQEAVDALAEFTGETNLTRLALNDFLRVNSDGRVHNISDSELIENFTKFIFSRPSTEKLQYYEKQFRYHLDKADDNGLFTEMFKALEESQDRRSHDYHFWLWKNQQLNNLHVSDGTAYFIKIAGNQSKVPFSQLKSVLNFWHDVNGQYSKNNKTNLRIIGLTILKLLQSGLPRDILDLYMSKIRSHIHERELIHTILSITPKLIKYQYSANEIGKMFKCIEEFDRDIIDSKFRSFLNYLIENRYSLDLVDEMNQVYKVLLKGYLNSYSDDGQSRDPILEKITGIILMINSKFGIEKSKIILAPYRRILDALSHRPEVISSVNELLLNFANNGLSFELNTKLFFFLESIIKKFSPEKKQRIPDLIQEISGLLNARPSPQEIDSYISIAESYDLEKFFIKDLTCLAKNLTRGSNDVNLSKKVLLLHTSALKYYEQQDSTEKFFFNNLNTFIEAKPSPDEINSYVDICNLYLKESWDLYYLTLALNAIFINCKQDYYNPNLLNNFTKALERKTFKTQAEATKVLADTTSIPIFYSITTNPNISKDISMFGDLIGGDRLPYFLSNRELSEHTDKTLKTVIYPIFNRAINLFSGFPAWTQEARRPNKDTHSLTVRFGDAIGKSYQLNSSSKDYRNPKFPGNGFKIEPSKIPENIRQVLEQQPLLKEAMQHIKELELYISRGMLVLNPTQKDAQSPFMLSSSRGREPYALVVYNDHLQNHTNTVALLVPSRIIEEIFHGTEIPIADYRGFDPSKKDLVNSRLQPENLKEEEDVINLCSSSCLEGGFCNGRKPGSKPFHSWELQQSKYKKDKTGHVHKIHINGDNYSRLESLWAPLAKDHEEIAQATTIFQQSIRALLIMQALYHKGYIAESNLHVDRFNPHKPRYRMLEDCYKWHERKVQTPNEEVPVLVDCDTDPISKSPNDWKIRLDPAEFKLELRAEGGQIRTINLPNKYSPEAEALYDEHVLPLVTNRDKMLKRDLRFYNRSLTV